MQKPRGKYLWFGLALLLLVLAVGIFFRPNQLLDTWLRPRLAAMAGEKLGAEVSIGRLIWQGGGFVVSDLSVNHPHYYQLSIPRVQIELSLAELLVRRVSSLEIVSPKLVWQSAPPGEGDGFPARAPVAFGRISVHDGTVDFREGDNIYQARRIDFAATGGDPYNFTLSAFLGEREPVPIQLAGKAEWREGLAVSLESFDWDRHPLLAGPLDWSLSPGDGSAGGGRLHLARFDAAALARILAGMSLDFQLPGGGDFVLRGLDLNFSLAANRLAVGILVAAGDLSYGEMRVPLEALNLHLSGWGSNWQIDVAGRFAGENPIKLVIHRQGEELQGRLQATLPDPGQLKTMLAGGEKPSVAGGLQLTATVSGSVAEPSLVVEAAGIPSPTGPGKALLDLAPLRLKGRVAREAEGWRGRADLFMAGSRLASIQGDLQRFSLETPPLTWRQLGPLLGPDLRGLLGSGQGLRGRVQLSRAPGGAWSGTSRLSAGRMKMADKVFQQLVADVTFAEMPGKTWSGNLSLRGKRLVAGDLALEGMTAICRWRYGGSRLAFSGARAESRLSGGEGLSAKLSLVGSGFWQPDRWQVGMSKVGVVEIEALAADGLAGLSGGRLQGRGNLNGGDGGPLRLTLDAELGVNEALWGPYYADLSGLPARLALDLALQPEKDRVQVKRLQLSLAEIGDLQASGRLSDENLDLTAELDCPDLSGKPAELIRSIVGESHDLFRETLLAGGMRARLNVSGRDRGWRLRGEIYPEDLAFQAPAVQLSLSGLSGRLPFELTFGKTSPDDQGSQRVGSLQYGALELGPASMAAGAMLIRSAPDRFAFAAPLVLNLADGRMVMDRLELGRDREGIKFDGLFTVAGVDLEALSRQLELPLMKGRIDADLGHIRYAGSVLRSEGEAQIQVFGGDIRIRNIRLDASSLAYLQIFADIEFSAIDLYQVTQTLAFGVMNGIVDGHIRNLRLFGATPARFSARIESRQEGKRNISVKALNNLTILSQGGLSAALSRGIYRFVDFYRYRKIGILCDLEKDVFHLRGTARPDSDRYLVFGGLLPPKIDIIAPPAAISFSEMLKRLQRLERTDR